MSNEVAIRATLETGDAVSNANQLTRALDSLGQAMEKATVAGDSKNAEAYGKLMLSMRKQMLSEAKMGGGAVEEQRNPAMRTVHGITTFLHRGAGYIGSAGSGNVAGAALGAAGDSAGLLESMKGLPAGLMAGGAILGGLVAVGAGANKLAEQFEKVMQPSMELAATLGMLGSDAKKNSIAFSEAFNRSAEQAAAFGYTMEEGIQLAIDLGKRGLSKDAVFSSEAKIFQYQRTTGADRGTLTEAEALSGRYGLAGDSLTSGMQKGPPPAPAQPGLRKEDVLALTYGGTLTSGMQKGQFQEYLGATLRIFEEGLSRGVIKGFGEITRAQNMLAAIGSTWKGELGAQRYQKMNDAVVGASGLNSDYDVIMYKAMQGVLSDAGKNSSDYVAVARGLDKGLTPELLNKSMNIIEKELAGGDRTETIIQAMKLFGLNATGADEMYTAWKSGKLSNAVAIASSPEGKAQSTELSLLSEVQEIRKNLANAGQNVLPAKEFIVSSLVGLTNLLGGSKMLDAYKFENQAVLGGLFNPDKDSEKKRIATVFGKAFENKNQPDSDKDAVGDYAESAQRAQLMLQSLSPSARLKMALHPELYADVYSGLKSEKDFPGFEKAMKDRLEARRIDGTQGYANPGMDYIKQLGLGDEFNKASASYDPNALAIAGMAKDTYGSDILAFKSSALGQYLASQIKEKSKDGFTGDEWNEIMGGVLPRYAKPGTPAAKTNRYEIDKGRGTDELYRNIEGLTGMVDGGPRAREEFSTLLDIFAQYGDQLNAGENKKIFEAAQSRTAGDKTSDITLNEVLSIMAKVLHQLQSVGVNIDKYAGKLAEASKFEFYVEGN